MFDILSGIFIVLFVALPSIIVEWRNYMGDVPPHYLAFYLLYFILPFIILCWRNRFDNWKKSLARFVLAAFCLWLCHIAGMFIIYFIDVVIVGGEARERMLDFGNAGIVIAVLGGWIYASCYSLAVWRLIRLPIALWRLGRALAQGISVSCTKTHSKDSTAI